MLWLSNFCMWKINISNSMNACMKLFAKLWRVFCWYVNVDSHMIMSTMMSSSLLQHSFHEWSGWTFHCHCCMITVIQRGAIKSCFIVNAFSLMMDTWHDDFWKAHFASDGGGTVHQVREIFTDLMNITWKQLQRNPQTWGPEERTAVKHTHTHFLFVLNSSRELYLF